MKIFIDPGHGGQNPGATYNGRKESEDVYKLSVAVKELLKKQGAEVVISRDADSDPELSDRAKAANNFGADYFLSIHRNAFMPNLAEGVEAWCFSGIKRFGDTFNKAMRIVNDLCNNVGFINRGVKLGAPSYTDFAVNRETKMPSALLELGFIDSISDNARFDGFFETIAETIAKAVFEANGGKWIMPGDIDADGKITSADARTALRAAVGLEELTDRQKLIADIDDDGKITSADAREIMRKAVNLNEKENNDE